MGEEQREERTGCLGAECSRGKRNGEKKREERG
jgi:hypothetical protein